MDTNLWRSEVLADWEQVLRAGGHDPVADYQPSTDDCALPG
jgi:hypothetical protein